MYKIGVISDTHGMMRKEVLNYFKDCKFIIHAGDIGKKEVIEKLSEICEVSLVRGNCDRELWTREIPLTEMIEIEGHIIYILHNIDDLDIDLQAAGVDIVIWGHSHRPLKLEKEGVLFLNPGSAGPRRFSLPISAAIMSIEGKDVNVEFMDIESL